MVIIRLFTVRLGTTKKVWCSSMTHVFVERLVEETMYDYVTHGSQRKKERFLICIYVKSVVIERCELYTRYYIIDNYYCCLIYVLVSTIYFCHPCGRFPF